MDIFCNSNEIDTLISKWLYEESKVKLSQLEIASKRYCRDILSFALFSTDNYFEISVSISLLLQNLLLLVQRVSLCSLQIIAFKLVRQLGYCYKMCPCSMLHDNSWYSSCVTLGDIHIQSGAVQASYIRGYLCVPSLGWRPWLVNGVLCDGLCPSSRC